MESNQQIVNKFFKVYSNHDVNAIRRVMDENVKWYFKGRHPLAGIKNGVEEVVAFFDTMGKIMSKSKPEITKLIVESNEKYFIECQHIKINRPDGINVEHYATVLWTIENRKIIEGRHFFADPEEVDNYFRRVVEADEIAISINTK
jgi:ketosteroid isomerase-like protein